MSDIEEKREELIRRLKKVALISSIILAILVAITVAVRLQPIVHPTGKSLIKWGMLPYMQKNSIRGTADIKNDVTVDLSSSLGSGMTSDIAVATTGSAFVVDNNKMYIGGSTSVKYSDLAETTNYFKVYKDLKKSKQYVYYINSEPGQDYMTDYENWAAIDAPKTSYDNIPEAIGKCLYNMSDMTMTKLKNSPGYTVEGKMDESSATALIRCLDTMPYAGGHKEYVSYERHRDNEIHGTEYSRKVQCQARDNLNKDRHEGRQGREHDKNK